MYNYNQLVPCPKMWQAIAVVRGGQKYPNIRGRVYFRNMLAGSLACTTIHHLPDYKPASEGSQPIGPFGFHLHEFGSCSSLHDDSDDFTAAGQHWNPHQQPHGNHAGDFPVLFSNNGFSYMCFYTDKFRVEDIIGKSVIIHENPDDYRTQPAGNSGKRIACGVVGWC
jgi:Cu-Zn family superoxide dismutase